MLSSSHENGREEIFLDHKLPDEDRDWISFVHYCYLHWNGAQCTIGVQQMFRMNAYMHFYLLTSQSCQSGDSGNNNDNN